MSKRSLLIIHDYPLLVSPKLAARIGLDEAIFAQQLHYLCDKSVNVRDGEKWVYNTYQQWHDTYYRFWSPQKIQRIVVNLEKLGAIITTQAYNKMAMDKTKWYRVNYDSQVFDISDFSNLKDDDSNLNKDCSDLNVERSDLNKLLPETFSKDYQQTTTTPAPVAEQQSQAVAETGQDNSPMVSAVFAPYFAMPLDWQPADPDMVAERLRFSQIPALDTDLCQDALLDFAEFWYARPDVVKTAAQWDAAFLQSVRGYRAKRGHLYHRDGSRKDSGSLKAAAGAADYVPAVSKTAQKTAWLRETGQARLDGKTSGSLKPVIFATVCEGLAQMLETGASKGAPMLEGLPAVLGQWEASLTATLAEDADGSRVSTAFAALIGQGDVFPTVPMLTQNLPPLLPQFRQPETPKQGGRRLGRGDGARAEALSRIGKKQGAKA